jgi:hypothetical protein
MKSFNFLLKNTEKLITVDDEIRNLPVANMNDSQIQKWTNNLQSIIIFNRGCYFFSAKLQEYQKSNLNIVFYLLNLFILLFITVLFFGAINFALYKVSPSSYIVTNLQTFFGFIYYSFNTIFLSSIREIIPANAQAHALKMIEIFFSFLLITIFTVLIFNIRSKKHTEELDEIITKFKAQASNIESRVQSEFKLSVTEAITELERLKSSLIKVIYYFSKHLGDQ